MRLHLVDSNADLVASWRQHFAPFPEVDVQHDDILAVATHCLVSPANSYGYMDGGIDLVYARFFGSRLERAVRDLVLSRPEGHLPVGAAEYVSTGHDRIPFMIIAPTMLLPEHVPALHAQRALRAVLRLIAANPELGGDVFCPGLGSGVGAIPPDECAREMAAAYVARKAA
jgi:O-acetyl-ADP-ribose deacetylase (regulator of RNase III)